MGVLGSLFRQQKSKRPLWQQVVVLSVTNRWGRLTLLAAVLAVVWLLTREYLIEEAYPTARDDVLRIMGFGFYPLTAWLLLGLGALRFDPRLLSRRWRWWLATALVITSAQAVLGGIHGPAGVVAKETLGGVAGQWLWGSFRQGVPVVLGLVVAAYTILWPRSAYKTARSTLRMLGRLAVGSLQRLQNWALQGAKAGGRMARDAAISLVRPRRQPATTPAAPSDSEVKSSPPGALEPEPPDYADLEFEDGEPELLDIKAVPGPAPISTAPPYPPDEQVTTTRRWNLPSLDSLEHGLPTPVTEEETEQVARKIEETLGHHSVQVTVDQIKPGPTVTLYGLSPGWVRRTREVKERDEQGNLLKDERGRAVTSRKEEQTRVKVDSIVAREKDLALALAAPSLRIQAPVPGESVVGIEVPNREPSLVALRSVMESPIFQEMVRKGGLALSLGQGSGGDPVVADLRRLPHLLIAGATGSGKSVGINTMIVSLMSQVPPENLRLLLIDPKRVELTPYNGLPHLVAPVEVDTEPAVRALKGMMREMFRRYRRLEELGVRNIEGYHRHPQRLEPMPYVVIAVDELADLMMAATYEVEQTLTRLAQLGRATGIHLIVATQRPSVDVVTGLIKANFPSRISFAVVSQVDSRTILDAAGADRLLGKGDMLFLSGDTPKPQRVQGAYVSDHEIRRLMEFWRTQDGPPLPLFDLEPGPDETKGSERVGEENGGPRDELLDRALELASRYSHLSTSLLQRRLRIGYPRAARLMDQLEDEGVIGPGEQGKSREVLRRGE